MRRHPAGDQPPTSGLDLLSARKARVLIAPRRPLMASPHRGEADARSAAGEGSERSERACAFGVGEV